MENKTIAMCLIMGLMLVGSVVVLYKQPEEISSTSFCDSAPLEYGSNYPPTCYEAPQSWIDEGKVYVGEKLEVKK